MPAKNDPQKCLYCAGCLIVCPVAAIELAETRIIIDEAKCIECGACVRVCPVGAMSIAKKVS
ncbi:MAG: 4Fe-4S dicluster domain-containing protein [Candidatus Diapherotrites archaeon]|nr:4Fe-4S dicluster domain-containing protein [Candidatus Diapherotrites archaeon]